MPVPLSESELAHYDEHGFVIIRSVLASDDVEALRERYWAIADGEIPAPSNMLVMRDVMVAKGLVVPESRRDGVAKLQDLHDDPVFHARYIGHPRLLDLAQTFCGPDIKSAHTMIINKPKGVDGRHPLHQDLLYFPFRPADHIVGIWTALDRCERDNGTLCVVPGSHKGKLLEHGMPDWEAVNYGYFGIKNVDGSAERLHVELDPGDGIMFHPLLLHGSGHNRSGRSRLAISAHYASAACKYLPHGQQFAALRRYRLERGQEHTGGI